MKIKRTIALILSLVILSSMAPGIAFADDPEPAHAITIKTSKAFVSSGDIIDVEVLFSKPVTGSISVLELWIPIDTSYFTYVEDSFNYYLQKHGDSEYAVGDGRYIPEKKQVFCNWVDVSGTIPASATDICSFKLRVNQGLSNGSTAMLTLVDGKSFLEDENAHNIPFSITPAYVTVGTGPDNRLTLISSSQYRIDETNSFLRGVKIGTSVALVTGNFAFQENVRIVNSGGSVLSSQDLVGTGAIVQLMHNSVVADQLTVVVPGDPSGDAKLNAFDIAALQSIMLQTSMLTGAYRAAADCNEDGLYNAMDIGIMQQAMLKG